VVKGEYDIAGAKEDIAKKFESLGVEIIAKSELLPGFCIAINTKTVSKEEILNFKKALLSIEKNKLKTMGPIISKGFDTIDIKEYKVLKTDIDIPKKGNMK
jgi:phosphonate transport system substrate-binding protein